MSQNEFSAKTRGIKAKTYIENNIPYGFDSKGNGIILKAFAPLYIAKRGDFYSLVKPKGRGNYRNYLIKNDLLCFGRYE